VLEEELELNDFRNMEYEINIDRGCRINVQLTFKLGWLSDAEAAPFGRYTVAIRTVGFAKRSSRAAGGSITGRERRGLRVRPAEVIVVSGRGCASQGDRDTE
jgi:hypothetical protein